ncbi:MAG: formate dehydrogenase accessory protein FdhE [Acidobacteria bacterium]|nr:formate dehydrogenase accessory protein FdhE [Acidobacteriota bacterium]MBI3656112.1 formate dehydrogenase accessory protein FdhE [Acidobacteriota bacterium]
MSRVWDQRIVRASHLLSAHGAHEKALRFCITVLQFQKNLYLHIGSKAFAKVLTHPAHYTLSERLELRLLLPWFPSYLTMLSASAPAPLASMARQILSRSRESWESLLVSYWKAAEANGSTVESSFQIIARGFLQPYAEFLMAQSRHRDELSETDSFCPKCRHRPQLAMIREVGEDLRFSLLCSLCAAVWDHSAMICPNCGPQAAAQMVYETDPYADYLSAQGCAACSVYFKIVDLVKEPAAVPSVDELAFSTLDLTMAHMGFRKIEPTFWND